MKKAWFILLQIFSVLLFAGLFTGVYKVVRKIANSEQGFEYNLGYALGALIAFGTVFWLSLKLFRYSDKKRR